MQTSILYTHSFDHFSDRIHFWIYLFIDCGFLYKSTVFDQLLKSRIIQLEDQQEAWQKC